MKNLFKKIVIVLTIALIALPPSFAYATVFIVPQGGTGAATLTGLLQGNGTGAITGITNSSTTGQVLRVTGTSTYAWGALNLASSNAVTGILQLTNGGTGANLSATGGTGQYLKQVTSGAAITVGTIPASDIASGAALTKTNDTNVTLTLGGTPASALLAATSLTLGWTGTLAVSRGGTGVSSAQGNGTKVQLSSGTTTTNDCVKFDANGNTVDNGAVCGSSTPAGSDKQIQFNDGGTAFGATSDFTFDKTGLALQLAATDTAFAINSGGELDLNINGDGERFDVTTGQGLTADSTGGNIDFNLGDGFNPVSGNGGTGGSFLVFAGSGHSGTSTGRSGGDISLNAGLASGNATGGQALLAAGDGGATGNGGDLTLITGQGNGGGTNGRFIFQQGGAANAILDFGNVTGTKTFSFPNTTGTITVLGNTTTGSGSIVLATSPTLVTPVLGAATYTTLSGGNVTDSGLTAGRATFAGTAGLLSDNAGFLFTTSGADQIITLGQTGTTTDIGQIKLSYVGSVSDQFITLTPAGGTSGAKTITIPNATDTLVGKATTDTLTNKTLSSAIVTSAGLVFNGAISGTITLEASGAGGTVLVLPNANDTLVAKATTDTFTNKTFDTAGTGNALKINGTAITAVTGTGSVVLGTTPTIGLPNIVDTTDATKKISFVLSGMTTAKTLTLSSSQATTQTLTIPTIRQAEILAIKPQISFTTPADPATTTSTTGVMMGLAGAITPQVTGRIRVQICGDMDSTISGDGAQVQIITGTGTAPTNGAALTGTAVGSLTKLQVASTTNRTPFCVSAIVTGLTLGTAIWMDISLAAITGGTARVRDISITAFEL